jgi:hypothetical protein
MTQPQSSSNSSTSLQSSTQHVSSHNNNNSTNDQTPQQQASSSPIGPTQQPHTDGGAISTATFNNNTCVWSPSSSVPCAEMLRRRLPLPLNRLLFVGDSTMHNLVLSGGGNALLVKALMDDALAKCPTSLCRVRTSERCNRTYGLEGTVIPDVPDNGFVWLKPEYATRGEGPVSHGKANPGCSDCGNCNSRFLDCTTAATATEPNHYCSVPHGGYVYTEFVRDVVWQSRHYNTTQENTAALLHDGSGLYPNTACVMAAGYHDIEADAGHDNMGRYVRNVNWYLSLYLDQVCHHIVWLANAAPASNNFTQSIARVQEWNEAVRHELTQSEKFQQSTTYLDIWSASFTGNHIDNLHMDGTWNIQLAQLFVQLLQ